ncbi:MAG: selenocysteine-specific translation elongation factor [Blastocatellia bacterium]|nr:selenocysteine-specific translation elongation factor [Blastocatellia bacterium]
MKNIIIGTAGHIDHGKTSLVRALTGTDTDRLKEEKQRGITIDIGFAHLDLDDFRFGFVDVPGHERFVKNMLAGAHGIDLVMLVIAADEAVMPQTREHLDICRLLHVPSGLTVLTKIDMVDAEWQELATSEVETFLKGSFLEGKPIVPVSTRTGEGIETLKQTLVKLAQTISIRPASHPPRLPIDRVFSVKGFGTVVTGTLIAGSLQVGDEIDIHPTGQRTKVRGIEVHGQSSESASVGQRTAVNLQGVDIDQVERGHVLTPAGRFAPTQMLDVKLELLASAAKPLKNRARVRLHHGTSEVMARVGLLGVTSESETGLRELAPGQHGYAQLRLESPILALAGDRFIIRQYSPQITIGGGTILDVFPRRHRNHELGLLSFLMRLATGSTTERVAAFIEEAGPGGVTLSDLDARTGESDATLAHSLEQLRQAQKIYLLEANTGRRLTKAESHKGTRICWKHHIDGLKTKLLERVTRFHKQKPLQAGMPREEAREQICTRFAGEVFRLVVETLTEEKQLVAEGELLRLANYQVQVSGAEAAIKEKLEQTFRNAGLQGLSMQEAFETLKLKETQAKPVYFLLCNQKTLVRIGDFTFHTTNIQKLIADVRAQKATQPTLDIAFFKDRHGLSRKYAIPLLEYLDAERITRRVGNVREIL